MAYIRLGQDVADRAVGKAHGQRRRRQVDGRGGQPVQRVIAEGLGQISVGIGARQRIAEQVIAIGQVLHRVAGAG